MNESPTDRPALFRHPLFSAPWLPFLGSLLSGFLLAAAFPGSGDRPTLAFAALLPLLFAADAVSPRKAAGLGLLSGFVFFALTLSWLHNLTHMVDARPFKLGAILGYAALALYCALYVVPFAVVASLGARKWAGEKLRGNLRLMFALTVVWVAGEYLRGLLLTGFPWNPLGVSQYANLALIQVATWGGVYCVSALIVWMNAALFVTLRQYLRGNRLKRYRAHFELMAGLFALALAMAHGLSVRLNRTTPPECVNVAVIQPNVAQEDKWDEDKNWEVRERLQQLTETALRLDRPDLVVWPETALPDFVRASRPDYALVRHLTSLGAPLLVGTMDVDFLPDGNRRIYNASILFSTNALNLARYAKQHLVPFGEYVPFPGLFNSLTPVEIDFDVGTEATLMNLPGKPPFSVLICFEDIVPPLAVKAVRNGARWLVNQSNDAWFDPSAQSEQHLAHAVFRCVENRVPMIRCCNTGVSCAIDAYGNVQRPLKPRTAGVGLVEIRPRTLGMSETFFTRNPNAFAKFCVIGAATVFFALRFRFRRLNPDSAP